MTDFYNSQSSSYDYNNYRDLSTANRAKGFDCSGFVGWSAYQVMQSKSGVGSGYTVVSGEIGSYYKSMGWGSILTQANLASDDWTVYPGDVGYDSGHTWIILGQCADKSAVIVHSTPNAGVQIAGTPIRPVVIPVRRLHWHRSICQDIRDIPNMIIILHLVIISEEVII